NATSVPAAGTAAAEGAVRGKRRRFPVPGAAVPIPDRRNPRRRLCGKPPPPRAFVHAVAARASGGLRASADAAVATRLQDRADPFVVRFRDAFVVDMPLAERLSPIAGSPLAAPS